jgi:LmbE family N-acetylglucosaminyl deacetylase
LSELRLMAVHAHPDDESSSTGGVLAAYSAEGIRTVVVTCTNGEFGDAPGGVKPGEDGHDEATVAQIRLAELRQATKLLGVTDLELLGYHDSGMPEWEYKNRPDAFCNIPAAQVTTQISGLIEHYLPQVVITYDDKGLYQHPDHVYASQMAQAAVAATGIPAKLYLSTIRGGNWGMLRAALREAGVDVPEMELTEEQQAQIAAAEAAITTTADIRSVLSRKREALMAHASQVQDSWFAKLPPDLAEETFGFETFVRVRDTTGTPLPETDLFAGIEP